MRDAPDLRLREAKLEGTNPDPVDTPFVTDVIAVVAVLQRPVRINPPFF